MSIVAKRLHGWIKAALGMEVGLGSGHIMLDGDTAPLPKKGAEPPVFGLFLLWPNGCINQDANCYTEVGVGPSDVLLDSRSSP